MELASKRERDPSSSSIPQDRRMKRQPRYSMLALSVGLCPALIPHRAVRSQETNDAALIAMTSLTSILNHAVMSTMYNADGHLTVSTQIH